MRFIFAFLLALLLAGCGEEQYTPNPPQLDTSLEIGDEGVLHVAGIICNSVELYRLGVREAEPGDFNTLVRALEDGNCTPEDEEDLSYSVVDIAPIEEEITPCKLIYMTTIETDEYGTLYASSDEIPGITQEQIDYRVDCLKKLRQQES